jgi:hypothetical protein
MPQHCTPMRDVAIRQRRGCAEWRTHRLLGLNFRLCEQAGPPPLAFGAEALEAQRVIAICAYGAPVAEPGLASPAGLTGLAIQLRLVGGRK